MVTEVTTLSFIRSEPQESSDMLRRGRAKRQHGVMKSFQIQNRTFLDLPRPTNFVNLRVTHVIRRKLRGREAGSTPFASRLTLFLKSLIHHQVNRLLFAHAGRMDFLVQNGIDD